MPIDVLGGLGRSSNIIGSLYTGNLYLECLGGDLLPKDFMGVGIIVIAASGIKGTVGGSVGLGCGCGVGCNLGPVIFLLEFGLCPFLGRTE